MTLRLNKSKFYKKTRIKIINQRNKDRIGNPHKSQDNFEILYNQHKF